MPDLSFAVNGVDVVPFSAAPTLAFQIAVSNTPQSEVIHTIVLRCQLQLEVARRRYSHEEETRLYELFGEPTRWGQTLRTMLWTHASVIARPFAGSTTIELPVPCTFDFNVAAMKYFYGLSDGDVPVLFLFSGSIFYEDPNAGLRVSPISWEKEARYRFPVKTWQDLMDTYYPNVAWLHLRRDVFDRLYEFKSRQSIATWEHAVDRLLSAASEESHL